MVLRLGSLCLRTRSLADNRIKNALVLLPAFAITIWLASEIGSEDYLIPAVVTCVFAGLVIFNAFTKSIRLSRLCCAFYWWAF